MKKQDLIRWINPANEICEVTTHQYKWSGSKLYSSQDSQLSSFVIQHHGSCVLQRWDQLRHLWNPLTRLSKTSRLWAMRSLWAVSEHLKNIYCERRFSLGDKQLSGDETESDDSKTGKEGGKKEVFWNVIFKGDTNVGGVAFQDELRFIVSMELLSQSDCNRATEMGVDAFVWVILGLAVYDVCARVCMIHNPHLTQIFINIECEMERSCDYPVTCCCWSATWGEAQPEPGPNDLRSCTSPPSVGEDTLPSVAQFFSLTTKLRGEVKVRFWASSSFRLFDTGIRSDGCCWAPQGSCSPPSSGDAELVDPKDGVWCLSSRTVWCSNFLVVVTQEQRSLGLGFSQLVLDLWTGRMFFPFCPTTDGSLVMHKD